MREPPFASYDKIPESPQEWRLDERGFRQLGRERWVVTEKIHGANFCLISDGADLRCANRRRLLGPADDFFGHREAVAGIRAAALAASAAACLRHGAAHALIYGELFGGAYPHPGVPPTPGARPVQTGIFYAPDVRFCAFDLALGWPDRQRRFLGYAEALELFAAAGLFCAEPLLIGSYAAALAFPERFDSTIPRRLGLPPLGRPNLAEGVVIKPLGPLIVESARGPLRPILKKKIPEFAEDARYHEAVPPATRGGTRLAADAAAAGAATLEFAAFNLLTENRVRSAISKLGYRRPGPRRAAPSRSAELFALLVDEVLGEVEAAHADDWQRLPAAGRAALRAFVRREARRLLKGFFAREPRRV